MKMFLLIAIFPLVAIVGCSDKEPDKNLRYFDQRPGETNECHSYRMMTGAPMAPDAHARLREKCEASIKKP